MNRNDLVERLIAKSSVSPIYVSEITKIYPKGSEDYEFVSASLDAKDVEIIDDSIELEGEFNSTEEIDEASIDLTNLPFRGDIVELFLRDISNFPVLTAEEEFELFKVYNEGIKAEERLGLDAAGIDLLDDETRAELLNISILADEARDKIINCNLRLVVHNAKGYNNRGLSFMDLIQEGSMGLMVAINKFDYERGYKFSTYATNWIRQAISRALDVSSRTIRVPSHIIEKNNKIIEATRRLSAELGREATDKEIADDIGISEERVRAIKLAFASPISLEMNIGEGDDSTLGDFVKDSNGVDPYEYTKKENLKEVIATVLGRLSEREASVLALRYGIGGGKPMTLEDVGARFNLTRERIRQIEARALKKLRDPKTLELLKDFLNNE